MTALCARSAHPAQDVLQRPHVQCIPGGRVRCNALRALNPRVTLLGPERLALADSSGLELASTPSRPSWTSPPASPHRLHAPETEVVGGRAHLPLASGADHVARAILVRANE